MFAVHCTRLKHLPMHLSRFVIYKLDFGKSKIFKSNEQCGLTALTAWPKTQLLIPCVWRVDILVFCFFLLRWGSPAEQCCGKGKNCSSFGVKNYQHFSYRFSCRNHLQSQLARIFMFDADAIFIDSCCLLKIPGI